MSRFDSRPMESHNITVSYSIMRLVLITYILTLADFFYLRSFFSSFLQNANWSWLLLAAFLKSTSGRDCQEKPQEVQLVWQFMNELTTMTSEKQKYNDDRVLQNCRRLSPCIV